VDSVTVDGGTHRAPAGARVEIGEDGTATGNLGCNRFTARVAFEDGRLRLEDTTATERGCAKEPMAFERTLARTLTAGPLRAETGDGRLTLTTDHGDTVRLSTEEPARLYGTRWTVTDPATDGRAHLTLDRAKGTVTGVLGCNHVTAGATVRDGTLTLGPAATTRMMCEGSLMQAEKRLLRLFDGRLHYRIDHHTLTLTSANGETVRAVAAR
jgi:heat shock protein HslJ